MRYSVPKRHLVLAVLAIFPSVTFAGPASPVSGRDIRGRVVAADDGRAVPGAVVSVREAGRLSATTGRDGRFTLRGAEGPEVVLVVRKNGFDEVAVRAVFDEEFLVRLTSEAPRVRLSEDIIVEAAGLDRPAFEMPYAGRALSREDILEFGPGSLNEAAASVPGLSFVGGGFHSAPSLRGLARNRLVLLIDGVRTASLRTIGGHLGFVHPFAVGGLEVVKGPFSTLYGHDAVAGVLRVSTLKPEPGADGFALRGGGMAGYESASRGSSAAFFLAGGGPRASFLVSYGRLEEEDYRMGGGGILPRSGFTLTSVLAKAEWRPAPGHRFEALYLDTDGRNIGKASGDPALVNVHPSESNEIAAVAYEWRPNGRVLSALEARLSRGAFDLAADFRTIFGPRTVQSLRDLGEVGYGFWLKAALIPASRVVLFAGLDGYFQVDQRITGVRNVYQAGQESPASTSPLNEVPPASTRDVGVFVQGVLDAAPRWEFVFGGRADFAGERIEFPDGVRSRSFDPEWNGNAGLVFKISPSLRLGANIGTAFRLPTPKDRYFVGQTPLGLNIGNPDLRSEHSLNADLVLKVRADIAGSLEAEGSAAVFVNRIRDLIVIQWDKPTGVRTGVFVNAGRAEIYGIEAEAVLTTAGGWSVVGAVSVTGADVHGHDEILDDLPPLQGRLGVRRAFGGGRLWAGLDLRGAVAERRTSAGDLPAPAWLTADAAAGWRAGKGWAVRLAVENVFDTAYREFFDFSPLQRKGRSVRISLQAGF